MGRLTNQVLFIIHEYLYIWGMNELVILTLPNHSFAVLYHSHFIYIHVFSLSNVLYNV